MMKLVHFTVQDYRSITKAYKLPIDRSTILVGPNNEGKSNIVKALVTAMRILTEGTRMRTTTTGRALYRIARTSRWPYEWDQDFPIEKQGSTPNGKSVFIPEFWLDEQEVSDFQQEIKSHLNGTLPLKVALGPRSVDVTVAKRGPGAKALSEKSARIAAFVAERLDFDYIPAVRTAESAERIVDAMVARELEVIESDPEYAYALGLIADLQQPILDRLSSSIQQTLVNFLPDVNEVKVQISEDGRSRALRRSTEIIVDDGTATSLQFKGDGVQSLAALAIMRHASDHGASGKNLIVVIEEPESHLHPNAIHSLREVIEELAERHQLVVTTHCPLFVNRANVKSNIIVQNRKAKPAKSVEQIRDILGVRASDNLRHAELVLVVEGEDDRIALSGLLPKASSKLKSAVKNGTLAIDTLGGGSNLSYKVGLLQTALCMCHCFMDDDSAGRSAFDKAKSAGLLSVADVNFTVCQGMDESEFEDLLRVGVYEASIQSHYGVTLNVPHFKTSQKWSDRLGKTFQMQGKPWTKQIEAEVKETIAHVVAASKLDDALCPHKRAAFDALVNALEQRLGHTGG